MVFLFMSLLDLILKDIRKKVFEISHLKQGGKVLDICCGSGNQLFYFAKGGIKCFGIDKNEKAIQSAEKRRKKNNFHNVFFQVSDATKVPFGNSFFDCAIISLGLHENNTKTIDKIIFEAKRVLKNEGCLILVDFTSPLPRNFNSFIIKKIEWLVGKENFKNFNNYLKNGGLKSILENHSLREGQKLTFKGKAITLIKAGK